MLAAGFLNLNELTVSPTAVVGEGVSRVRAVVPLPIVALVGVASVAVPPTSLVRVCRKGLFAVLSLVFRFCYRRKSLCQKT